MRRVKLLRLSISLRKIEGGGVGMALMCHGQMENRFEKGIEFV